jgi:hypothetical protein
MWWIRNAVFILFTSVACTRQQVDNMLLDINVTFPSPHTRRVSHVFSLHIKACTCSDCPRVLDCGGISRVTITHDSTGMQYQGLSYFPKELHYRERSRAFNAHWLNKLRHCTLHAYTGTSKCIRKSFSFFCIDTGCNGICMCIEYAQGRIVSICFNILLW